MKTSSIAAAVATTLLAGPVFASGQIFSDGFETGDRSKTENAFTWTRTGDNVFVSSAVAHTGSNSLCFLYRGKPSGSDSTAEQRFQLGAGYTELWIQYYVYFPQNYTHRSDSPSNNKFLMLWSRDYQDMGNTAGMHLWADGNGNSNIAYTVGPNSPQFPLVKEGGHPRFVETSADNGKWMEVTFHWKRQTSLGSPDGVLEVWRKRENGTREKILSATSLSRTWGFDGGEAPPYNYIDQGYLLGWANSGFSEDTTICIDDITFAETPLIDYSQPKSPSAVGVK